MSDAQQTFYNLAVALAIGLLIGVERGWKEREAKEGGRVAGVCTYRPDWIAGRWFGALAVMGEVAIAAASAVVTALLLSYKPVLHHWVSALETKELRAGIKLLLISVVLLPILPNQGYGP